MGWEYVVYWHTLPVAECKSACDTPDRYASKSLTTVWQFIAVEAHSKLDSARVLAVEIAVNIIYHDCAISSNSEPADTGCLN